MLPAVCESFRFAFNLICASTGMQLYLFCAYKTSMTRKVINIFKEGTWMSGLCSVITNLWALSVPHVTSRHVTHVDLRDNNILLRIIINLQEM